LAGEVEKSDGTASGLSGVVAEKHNYVNCTLSEPEQAGTISILLFAEIKVAIISLYLPEYFPTLTGHIPHSAALPDSISVH
jgi:hypothetical protein